MKDMHPRHVAALSYASYLVGCGQNAGIERGKLMTVWTIEPLTGLGPLKIGMSSAAVASILDPVHALTHSHVEFDGSVREIRGLELPLCTFMHDKLHSIEANYRVEEVLFESENVFELKSRDVLALFERANGSALYGVGIVLFYDISISTSGFYKSKRGYYGERPRVWQDERTVTVSVRNAFQPLLQHFRKVKLDKSRK